MKRRIPFAVLPVIVVVAAGLGGSTSTDPGTGEKAGGEPWTGSPGVTVPVSSMTSHQRMVDWGMAGQPLRGRDRPGEGESDQPDQAGDAQVGGGKQEPVEETAPPKSAAPPKSLALDRAAAVAPK